MFEDLISRLGRIISEHRVPYMIIGGQAVLLYGTPRLTQDIDITLGISVDKLSDVVSICRNAGLTIIPDNYRDFVKKSFVLPAQDKSSGIRVDFIFSFTPYEQQAIKRSRRVKIKNRYVKFASVEDVIIHKIFAGRPRDIEDIRHVILKNPSIDRTYIRKWLRQFDKSNATACFTNDFNHVLKKASKR
jgi:hypothetical protein